MSTKFPRTYAMLKRVGLSPSKALEVLFDARRGSTYAVRIIRSLWRLDPRRGKR